MAVSKTFNLDAATHERAARKLLITVAEWRDTNGDVTIDGVKYSREILGRRTEDSSIEYNADIATSTDILGINYSDLNKTQPQQAFDPHLILGGDKLSELLNDIRRRNALTELSQFNLYIITAFIGDSTNGYVAERHVNCTITYDSFGGDVNVNFPITAYFSNDITLGTVDKLEADFTFTPDANVSI
jgi:hypothetical protein